MALAYSLVLLLCTMILFRVGAKSAAPSILWCLMWTAAFFLLFLFGRAFDYPESGVAVTFSMVAAACVGSVVGHLQVRASGRPRIFVGPSSFKIVLACTLAAGIAALIMVLNDLDVSLRDVGSWSALGDLARRNQVAMYAGWSLTEDSISFVSKVLLSIFQSGFIYYFFVRGCGVTYKGIVRAYLPSAIMISLALSAVTTVRVFVLVPVVWGISGFLAGLCYSGRERLNLNGLLRLTVLVALLAAFVAFLQDIRLGDRSNSWSETLTHMRPWVAGYIPAFSIWLETEWHEAPRYGLWLLRGIVAPLGIMEGEGFTERIELIQLGNGQRTNALTIFKVLVEDFGTLGAVMASMLLGWLGAIIYGRARRGSIFFAGLLVGVIAAVLWSPNYWFLGYGSRVMGLLVALGFLLISPIRASGDIHWNRGGRRYGRGAQRSVAHSAPPGIPNAAAF